MMFFDKDKFLFRLPWQKKEKKPNLIKDILSNPENFIATISIENDELIVKVTKK